MQFNIGDRVIHPVHGVGRIVKVERQAFTGAPRMYYEVSAMNTTVWVPVDAQDQIGLRLLTAKSELSKYRSVLKSRPASLSKDHGKRHFELTERLKKRSFQAVCEVVRDLTAHSWNKPLTGADTASLRKAREDLEQEWAASEEAPVAKVSAEIETLITHSRAASKKIIAH